MTVVVNMEANSRPVENTIAVLARRLTSLETQAKQTATAANFSSKPTVNTAAATKQLQLLNKTASGVAATVNSVKSSLIAAFAVGSAAIALTAVNAKMNSLADSAINLNNQLKQVTNTSAELVAVQKKLQAQARASYSDLGSSATTFVKLTKALSGMGKSEDQVLQFTETLSRAAATSGSSAETIKASMYQLSQGISSGVLRGEELNSVYEGIRPVAAIFENYLGVTSGELRELAAEGQLTTEVMVKALEAGMYEVEENFLRTTSTIASAKQAVADAVLLKVQEVDSLFGISAAKIENYLKLADFVNSVQVKSPTLPAKDEKTGSTGTLSKDLTVLEQLQQAFAALSKAAEYTVVIFQGSFQVLAAIVSRLSDFLPSVRLLERTLGSRLARSAKTAIASTGQSIRASLRSTFLNVFQYTGYGLQEAVNDLFTAESPEELEQAFEDLSFRIENYGKRWYNIIRNIGTLFVGLKNSFNDFAMSLGLVDQQLILIRKRTTDSFASIRYAAKELFTGFLKDLSNLQAVITVYNAVGVMLDRLSLFSGVILRNLGSIFGGMAQVVTTFVGAIFAPFEQFGSKVSKIFKGSKDVFGDLLDQVAKQAKAQLEAVKTIFASFFDYIKAGFYDVYIDVVGNSTWPDLLDGILAYASQVLPQVKAKFVEFASSIKSVFENISTKTVKVTADFQLNASEFVSVIGDIVSIAYSEIRAAFPVLVSYVSAGIATGIAFALDKDFTDKVRNFFKVGLAGLAGEFLLNILGGLGTLQVIAADVGTLLGEAAGSFVTLIIRNAPAIGVALLEMTNAFGQAFLSELGIIGKFINGLATVTGTSGLIGTILFGVGLPILLGNFKLVQTMLGGILTLLSGASIFGVGANKKGEATGVLGYLLLGDGRTILGYISLISAAIVAFTSGDFSSIATLTGLAGLLIFGPQGTARLILESLSLLAAKLGFVRTVSLASFAPVLATVKALGASLLAVGNSQSLSQLAGVFGIIRTHVVALVSQLGGLIGPLLAGLSAAFTPFFLSIMAKFRAFSAALLTFASTIGGKLGAVGRLLFGATGIAAIILAISLIFSSAANAGETASASFAGLGWADYGFIGVMLFGTLGLSALSALATKAVTVIFKNTLKAAALSSAIEGGLSASIGGLVVSALKRVALAIVAFIVEIPALVIAAVAAVVAGLGYLVYKAYSWFTTTKAERDAELKLRALKKQAAETQDQIEAVFDKDNVKSIFKTSKIKLDIEAFLDETILYGSSEESLNDISAKTTKLAELLDSANETIKSEGALSRAEIIAVRAAVKSLEQATKNANLDAYKTQTDSLRANILSALQAKGEVPEAAIADGKIGFTAALLNLDPTDFNKDTRILLGLLKDLELQLPKNTADPASAIAYFEAVEEMVNLTNQLETPGLIDYFLQDTAALETQIDELTNKIFTLRGVFQEGVNIEGRGDAFERRLQNIVALAEDLSVEGLDMEKLVQLPEISLAEIEKSLAGFKKKYKEGLARELDTEGLDRDTAAPSLDFVIDQARLRAQVNAAMALVDELVADASLSPLELFQKNLKESGIDIEVEIIPSQESFNKANELFTLIENKTKELQNLDPSESFKGVQLLEDIAAAQEALFMSLADTEQQLERVSSLVEGMPDVNSMLYLDDATINQIVEYGNKILQIMALIKRGGAGPGALNAPVGDGFADQAAATLAVTKNEILKLAGVPQVRTSGVGTKKSGEGGGGGKEAAKTWWEEFQDGLKELDLKIDDDILAGLGVGTIDSLTAMSTKYKAAQDALNNSAKGEVELRRESLKLMQAARVEAINALNDGTVGGAMAAVESADAGFSEEMIGRLNAASVAYATQLALRIKQLELERNTMALGSSAAVQATNAISSMKLELESLTQSSSVMRDAFNQGLQSFLKGQSTFKEFAEGLLDTFTSTIIEKFSTSFTDSLFNSLGLDNLFSSLFGGASKLGGQLGGGLEPGATPANPLWTKSADPATLLGGVGAGAGAGAGGGGGIFSWLFSLLGFASGGQVDGPGTGTSDSIVARLSKGEFVVNAKSTKQWLPMLEAINSNKGKMPAFANGGQVGVNNPAIMQKLESSSSKGSQQVFHINVTGDVSTQTKKEILAMLPEISAGVSMVQRERGSR